MGHGTLPLARLATALDQRMAKMRRDAKEVEKLLQIEAKDTDTAERSAANAWKEVKFSAGCSERVVSDKVRQQHVQQANLTTFMRHSSYIEMCGMLSREELTRSEFDTFLEKGLKEAVGKHDNLDKTLGDRAGAALAWGKPRPHLLHQRNGRSE